MCRLMILFLAGLGIAACSMAAIEPVRPDAPVLPVNDLSVEDRESLLHLINDLRREGCRCGSQAMPPAPPLALQTQMEEAAVLHVLDMYQHSRFSHTGSDGSKVGNRLSRTGYQWSSVGENIALGYSSVPEVFQGWVGSAGHCENMMNPDFKHLGAARKGAYWVTTFGRSR